MDVYKIGNPPIVNYTSVNDLSKLVFRDARPSFGDCRLHSHFGYLRGAPEIRNLLRGLDHPYLLENLARENKLCHWQHFLQQFKAWRIESKFVDADSLLRQTFFF